MAGIAVASAWVGRGALTTASPIERDARESPASRDEAALRGRTTLIDRNHSSVRFPALPPVSREVTRRPTPMSELEIAVVLSEGHELAFGEPPTDLRLGIAWAHICLEHRRGAEIENFNFGNMSVTEGEPGDYFVRVLRERKRAHYDAAYGRWRWYETRLRAFPTAVEGARIYWRHLYDHYNKALQLFSVGDGREAGRKLARDGYATTYPEPYTESIGDLSGEFKLRILPELTLLRERARAR